MIRNIHERELPDGERAGALIDDLASAGDRLWPHGRWPAMKLDPGLEVGAVGGHGPVRYSVSDLEPGRRATFRFSPDFGLDGHHWLELFSRDGRTVLRHVLEARPRGGMLLAWPLAIRWLHDALIEDALDRAAGAPPRRLGVYVRILRRALASARRPRRRWPGRAYSERR